MSTSLPVTEFLRKAAHTPIIDVRTPAEYAQGHIPQAFNLPLFTDQERAIVGTLYVQENRTAAILKGLEFVGPRLNAYACQAREWAVDQRLLVHCWRGGMRSGAMAWLFEQVGLHCCTLEKGYKAYRTHVLDYWKDLPFELHILGGLTGSGKTEKLHEMALQGEQVVDLEALAHHKGSAFGSLGQSPQPSTEHFENRLFHAFRTLDPSRPVWLEDESRNVGKCSLPAALWEKMQTAPFHLHELPYAERVARLLKEYGQFDRTALAETVRKIEKRLGLERCQKALSALDNGDVTTALCICLDYYDKTYNYHIAARLSQPPHSPETL